MIRKKLLLSIVAATIAVGAAVAGVLSSVTGPYALSFKAVTQKVEELAAVIAGSADSSEKTSPSLFTEEMADGEVTADASASAASLPVPPKRKALNPVPDDDALRINFYQNSVNAAGSRYTKGAVQSYNVETGEITVLREGISSLYGGVYYDGYYISVAMYFSPYRDWIIKWYLEDGSGDWVNPYYFAENHISGSDMSYDPWTDQVYSAGYLTEDHKYHGILTIDFDDYSRKAISKYQLEYSDRFFALTADQDFLYAMKYNGDLYRLDKITAEPELIGSTGLKPGRTASLMIDPRTRRLFVALTQYDSSIGKSWTGIYELDKKTGTVIETILEDETEEQRACLFGTEDINDGCPQTPEDLVIDFAPGALQGNINFKVPAENRGGEPVSGDVSYRIVANGIEIATGTTSYGATCQAPASFPEASTYRISVQLINGKGASRYARTKLSIGDEKPKAPVVSLSFADGKHTVSWQPATVSVNDGSISADLITYDVVRYPGEVKVAGDIKETTLTEDFTVPEDLTLVYYTVTATNRGTATSDAGKSNVLAYGAVTPAFDALFSYDNQDIFSAFSVIDSNNDNVTWAFIKGTDELRLNANSYKKDDWIVTPPVRMEAGNFYNIQVNASNMLPDYMDPEILDIMFGKEPTAEGLDKPVATGLSFAGKDYRFAGDLVKCEESGLYYVGVHAYGTTSWPVYIRNITISDPIGADAPNVVTDVKIASSFNNLNAVEIQFTCPSVNVDGKELSSLDKVEIYRDHILVGEVTDVAPGKVSGYVDSVEDTGKNYVYTFVGNNKSGKGRSLDVNSFIGIRRPVAPTGFKAYSFDGKKVKLSWNHSETDVEGNPINPAFVTYNISYKDGFVNFSCATVTGKNEAEFVINLPQGTDGAFYNFLLDAQTEGGQSEDVSANSCWIGPAVDLPVAESFAEGIITYPLGVYADNGASWSLYTDTQFSDGTASYDLDGAFLGMYGTSVNQSAYVSFPKIDLTGAENPVISFYSLAIGDVIGADKNEIQVWADNGTEEKLIYHTSHADAYKLGWHRHTISLAEQKGQQVVIRIRGIVKAYTLTLMDNFNIHELPGDNLSVLHIDAPSQVNANQEFPVNMLVENYASRDAAGADVVLYRNGDEIARTSLNSGNSLAPLGRSQVVFPQKISVIENEDKFSYFIDVEYDEDEEYSDNSSEEVEVRVTYPEYQTPANLAAEEKGKNTVELTWSAPDLSKVEIPFTTDDLEAYPALENQQAGGWLFIDRDGSDTGSANGVDFGSIPGSPSSWFIFNADNAGQYSGSFSGASGKQTLLSLYCTSPTSQRDDWAISPELSGKAQVITFQARSYADGYEESIQVLYSTTDTSPESFTEVKTFSSIPTTYELYSAELPEGARYFAIRNITNSGFMCLVDDITFQPALEITIDGYNIYRNGVKVNTDAVSGTEYTDTNVENGTHTYLVTASYNIGESRPSNEARVGVSGVNGTIAAGISVTAGKGFVEITGAEGEHIVLTAADGRTVATTVSNGSTTIPAAPGFYLVTVGKKTLKIVVR